MNCHWFRTLPSFVPSGRLYVHGAWAPDTLYSGIVVEDLWNSSPVVSHLNEMPEHGLWWGARPDTLELDLSQGMQKVLREHASTSSRVHKEMFL